MAYYELDCEATFGTKQFFKIQGKDAATRGVL